MGLRWAKDTPSAVLVGRRFGCISCLPTRTFSNKKREMKLFKRITLAGLGCGLAVVAEAETSCPGDSQREYSVSG